MAASQSKRDERFAFTADMIGSEILERFSTDIYNAKAIVRELVSNADDSYSQLEEFLSEAGKNLHFVREVRVDVADKSVIISDDGLGMDKADIYKLVSIALTDKRDMSGVRGYRGIGFWSAFTGGEQIVVESTKLNDDRLYRLTLNTKLMRQRQTPSTSIGSIMNDAHCVKLESESASREQHGTKVIVICEDPSSRLHSLVDDPEQMKVVLLEGCARRLPDSKASATHGPLYQNVSEFTASTRLVLPHLKFQGNELFKEYPGSLQGFTTEVIDMEIGPGERILLAKIWFATNTENQRLNGPTAGIRVIRDGFPVGKRNLDSDRVLTGSTVTVARPDLLDWHVGEVHLVHDELRPDASGENLPENVTHKVFREKLRAFYNRLTAISRGMQLTKSLCKDYSEGATYLAALAAKCDAGDKLSTDEEAKVLDLAAEIKKDNDLAKGRLPEGTPPNERKSFVRDEDAVKLRRQITTLVKKLDIKKREDQPESKDAGGKKGKARSQDKDTSARSSDTNGATGEATIVSVIDEIRDVVMELVVDDLELQQELLDRINRIAASVQR